MRKITLGLICLLACMALVLPLTAQEGFPLKGSWLGDWGPTTTNRNQLLVVFDWDGKVISGSINPGTETIVIKNASLNPTPTAAAVAAAAAAAAAPPAGARGPGAGAGTGAGAGAGAGGGGGRGQGAPPAAAGAAPAPAAGGAQAPRGGGNTLGAQSGGTTAAATVDWLVHFEGDGKDSKGATVHYVADGKIENIGLSNRILSGTWVSGAIKGTFRLQRQ